MNRADWGALGNLLNMAAGWARFKAAPPGTRASERALGSVLKNGVKVYKARTTRPKRTRR